MGKKVEEEDETKNKILCNIMKLRYRKKQGGFSFRNLFSRKKKQTVTDESRNLYIKQFKNAYINLKQVPNDMDYYLEREDWHKIDDYNSFTERLINQIHKIPKPL